ncbi:PREDICTED: rve domain-containing, partial [Prunus dulcis]
IEKLAFSLVVSARSLRPYFQAHTIHVLTNQPLRQVLQKPETSGRLVKWAIELGEFDIHYKPRPAMRGQAVADFLSEFTEPQASAAPQLITEPNPSPSQDQTPTKNTLDLTQPLWTLFVDGSSNAQGCGAGLVLVSPDKVALEYALRFNFQASNNEAEYEALLAGLRLAKEMDAKQIQIFSDSQLVVHQVNQDFTAKDASMTAYLQHARHLLATFHAHTIKQVPRSENSHADALARLASALEQGMGRHIHIEFLAQPSTQAPLICTIDHSPTWMDPILQFLQNQTLPANPAEARRVRHRSARYLVINGSLYKRGFSLPYLRCLTPEEGHYVLREIHEGICGNHSGAHSLAHKAIRQGYFWPSLHTDAQAFTQKCD